MDMNDLMCRIAKGEAQALNSFALAFGNRMFHTAYRLLGQEQLAEDAVQEVLIKVWQKAPVWDKEKSSASTWSYTLLTNICLDMLRRRKGCSYLDGALVEEDVHALKLMDAVLDKVVILRAMEKLNRKQYVSIVLSYVEGFKNAEVASFLGCSEKSVEGHLTRARKILQNELKNNQKEKVA